MDGVLSYLRLHDEKQPPTLALLRPPTRLTGMLEQNIIKLANSKICPVATWAVLDAKAMHAAGHRTDPQRFAHMLRTNQLSMAYVVHDKRSLSVPRLASVDRREIADVVADAVGVKIQPYEVQPLLDACQKNYSAQKWDPLVFQSATVSLQPVTLPCIALHDMGWLCALYHVALHSMAQ